jgi:hypothetical protein
MVSVNDLIPYAKNPKDHTDKDLDLIIKSIQRNGWGDPILVRPETNEILSGNGRYLAARKIGLSEVPVVYAPDGLTEKQKADLVIASNKLVEASGYNDNLGELIADFDLDIGDFGIDADMSMETDMPKLSDADKSPFQQKTFTLADLQADTVDAAIEKAKKDDLYGQDTCGNENTNGNALYVIALRYLNG